MNNNKLLAVAVFALLVAPAHADCNVRQDSQGVFLAVTPEARGMLPPCLSETLIKYDEMSRADSKRRARRREPPRVPTPTAPSEVREVDPVHFLTLRPKPQN